VILLDRLVGDKATAPNKRTITLSANQHTVLMPIGDVHFGSKDWPARRFRKHIEWGIDQGALFLGMGEYLDFTSESQRQALRSLRESQAEQIDDLIRHRVEEFAKVLDGTTEHWLGLLEGHHYWVFQDGTTSDQYLCTLLKAPFLGTSTLALLHIARGRTKPVDRQGNSVQGCDVTIFAHHGFGGTSRRQGGNLHRIEDLLQWIEADIYLLGHTHAKPAAPVARLYRTDTGYLYHRKKLLVRTGGWLRGYAGHAYDAFPLARANLYRGSYVEQKLLPPVPLGAPVLTLGYRRITKQVGSNRKGGKRISLVDICIPDIHVSL